MKNLKFYTALVMGMVLISCSSDEPTVDQVVNDTIRGAVLRTVQTISPSFNSLDTSSTWDIEIEAQDAEGGDLLSQVNMYVRFSDNTLEDTNGDGEIDELDDDFSTDESGVIMSVPASAFTEGPFGFPRTLLSLSFQESLDAVGITDPAVYTGGDTFIIRLELILTDGRTYTDVDASGNVSGGSFFSSPFAYTAALVCPSSLEGTHTFVSTNLQAVTGSCPAGPVVGSVTWTNLGGGQYSVSDLGFGQYESTCWDDGPATSSGGIFTDACNLIISGGLDQYGLIYTWVVTDVTGPNLTMSWSNDYGDGGDVVITREGGEDWPPLFTN